MLTALVTVAASDGRVFLSTRVEEDRESNRPDDGG